MFDLFNWYVGTPLAGVQVAFTLWMAVDAYKRGVDYYWFWIILLLQPVGTWAYFLFMMAPRIRFARGFAAGLPLERKLSLRELRYRVERMPTVVHRLALAERLMEKGGHEEAISHLEALLAVDENYCQAMHDLAICYLVCGQPDRALAMLERLLQRDPHWSDHRAWRTLIDVQEARGQPEDALNACRELERRSPRLENKCLLAEHLIGLNLGGEAADLLDQALDDHHFSPLGRRWRNWRWARLARQLLKEAESHSAGGTKSAR